MKIELNASVFDEMVKTDLRGENFFNIRKFMDEAKETRHAINIAVNDLVDENIINNVWVFNEDGVTFHISPNKPDSDIGSDYLCDDDDNCQCPDDE